MFIYMVPKKQQKKELKKELRTYNTANKQTNKTLSLPIHGFRSRCCLCCLCVHHLGGALVEGTGQSTHSALRTEHGGQPRLA